MPVGTQDIDSLIARNTPPASEKSLGAHLREAGFNQQFKDLSNPATEAWEKMIEGVRIDVEFLTDAAVRGRSPKNVKIVGVVAQPLSYLSLSLENTLPFQTHAGDTGLVVSPGAWMFHKGLTFPRRKDRSKVLKDLYGIWYVASQLGEFSRRAVVELMELRIVRPKWYRRFKSQIQGWIASSAPADWSALEAQDPSGQLQRARFEHAISELLV